MALAVIVDQRFFRCGLARELVVAETVGLVAAEPEVAVGGDHGRVFGGVGGAAPVAGLLLGSVDFRDDALAVGKQQEDIHSKPQKGLRAAFLDGTRQP
ncbi:hypothetical protein AB0E77_22300 [Streptomyces sp. NPDC032940]|uniref:hypothetical protein n=1 Tax=Streptomyces sp. NPDC032940 TaxID=3155366 RepID=UPI0033CE28AD